MDAKTIETLSVGAVKKALSLTHVLDPEIRENDKEQSWDGAVYIYKNTVKKKSNLRGRVPVQVKGTVQKDLSKETVTYPMSVVHLRNYLNDHGVMLFVVYVDEAGNNTIYYTALTPLKLKELLEEVDDNKSRRKKSQSQKTKSVRLKRFPDGCNDRINIFLNFYRDCRRQESFIDHRLYSIDELRNLGVLEQVTFSASSYGEKDYEAALLKSDVYFYAKITGSDTPQPIDMVISELTLSKTRRVSVRVGEKEYYQECKILRNHACDVLKLGQSFSITLPRETAEQTVKFNPCGSLRNRALDLEFILDCINHKGFYIDQYFCPLAISKEKLGDFDVNVQSEQMAILKKASRVLDLLGYSGDLNLNNLRQEENHNLMWLITAFIDGEPISGLREDLQPVHKMKIGDATFILYFKKLDQKGTYAICDFFKTSIDAYRTGPEGERQPTSQFTILRAADILEASNVANEILLPSFQKIEKNTSTYVQANLFMLELVRAYDMSKDVRTDILSVAYDFAVWIQNAPDAELPPSVKRLNYFQIIKRERLLNLDERQELYGIVEDNNQEDVKVGALLLLDDQLGAEIHFSKLAVEQKIEFQKYPIWRFWKTSD